MPAFPYRACADLIQRLNRWLTPPPPERCGETAHLIVRDAGKRIVCCWVKKPQAKPPSQAAGHGNIDIAFRYQAFSQRNVHDVITIATIYIGSCLQCIGCGLGHTGSIVLGGEDIPDGPAVGHNAAVKAPFAA